MNFTPLMSAAYCGNETLTRELIGLGSSTEIRDIKYRTPLQIALFRGYEDPKFSQHKLPKIYHLLQIDSLSLDIGDQLIKIDSSRAEYFLFNILLLFNKDLLYPFLYQGPLVGFSARQLTSLVEGYADSIWPAYRKKQTYLSSLLSRNEVNSNYTPSRRLFVRSQRSYYKLNPDIKIKTLQG